MYPQSLHNTLWNGSVGLWTIFQWFRKIFRLRLLDSVKEHWDILKKLLLRRDCDYVVNACDAGREGVDFSICI